MWIVIEMIIVDTITGLRLNADVGRMRNRKFFQDVLGRQEV